MPALKRPAHDLTATTGLSALSGERVVDIGVKTLDAAERLIATWDDTEPLLKRLIGKVKAFVESPDVDEHYAVKVLGEVAQASRAMANSAGMVLRAADGMTRLALLLSNPTQQKAPSDLTEKQLVGVVLETAKRIKREQGHCPLCTETVVTATARPSLATLPPEGEA